MVQLKSRSLEVSDRNFLSWLPYDSRLNDTYETFLAYRSLGTLPSDLSSMLDTALDCLCIAPLSAYITEQGQYLNISLTKHENEQATNHREIDFLQWIHFNDRNQQNVQLRNGIHPKTVDQN